VALHFSGNDLFLSLIQLLTLSRGASAEELTLTFGSSHNYTNNGVLNAYVAGRAYCGDPVYSQHNPSICALTSETVLTTNAWATMLYMAKQLSYRISQIDLHVISPPGRNFRICVDGAIEPCATQPGNISFHAPFGGTLFSLTGIGGSDDFAIDSFVIQYRPNQQFDLAISNSEVQTESGVGDDGIPIVAPGSAFQVKLSVTANEFEGPEVRSTTVSLQAGYETQSRTISLSSLQAANGELEIPFTVKFHPSLTGLQTITATVSPGNTLYEKNFSNNTRTIQVKVVGQLDLSVSKIELNQAAGMLAPTDADDKPILATVTPQTANPAPKIAPTRAEAQVNVHMNGTPTAGATSTYLQLKLGDQVIADNSIDVSQFHQGDNIVKVEFTPPTDPSLLGVLPLTAIVNATKAIQESNYTNNSFGTDINTMVLCKVEDAGRVVPFHAQTELQWAPQPYGIPDLSSGTFRQYGCSVTNLSMLFSSYGITSTPIGSPADPAPAGPHLPGLNGEGLDPGTLNSAMANYTTDFLADGSVGFDANNNPIWAGAAEVARAGYQAGCQITGSCDPANAPNVVSFKGLNYSSFSDRDAISAVQNEICSGNPVIMKFAKNGGGQHFMLATGIVWDKVNQSQTLRLNNPGSTQIGSSKDALYTNLKASYPSVIGYALYRPSSDPSMMFISTPMGIHFVVTDPLGRRAGFNPNTGTSYTEIPGAAYGEQSIDTPADPGFTPSTAVDERYFISSQDVPPGSYDIQVFSINGGSYYLDHRSFDSSGMTNDSHFSTGTLTAGNSTTATINHVTTTVPRPNAVLAVNQYAIQDTGNTDFKQAMVKIAGTLVPNSKSPLSITSSVHVTIGGVNGYQFDVPASSFTGSIASKKTLYIANRPTANVHMDSTGVFEISLRGVDLSTVDQNLLGSVRIEVDSTIGAKKVGLTCHQGRCSN